MKKSVLWMMAVAFIMAACSNGNIFHAKEGEAEAYYQKGYDCDRKMEHRMAEYYWKTAMAETENSDKAEDLAIYAKSASRLTNLLSVRGEYQAALAVAVPAAERLEKQHCDTTSDYTNLLVYIGCCKSRFGMSKEEVHDFYERAYQMHMENIKKHRTDESYKNAIAGVINIAYNCNETKDYQEALLWTQHFGDLISEYEQRQGSSSDYIDRQYARYDIYRAIALEGLGRKEEAAEVFDHFLKTNYSQTPNGRILGVDYLSTAGRWTEAASSYESLDELVKERGGDYSLETLQKMVLKKYEANKKAGRRDSTVAVSLFVCDHLDSAVVQMRRLEAMELSTIRDTEAQKAEQQAQADGRRRLGGVIATLAVMLLLTLWTLNRMRARRRIQKDYADLTAAYQQLDAKSRMEERDATQQHLSHSIQATMSGSQLPHHQFFDIHAMTEKASMAGGDFYDAILRDEKLFFCVGDGVGEGLDASLSMMLAKSQFHSLAACIDDPARIVGMINQTMSSTGGNPMSATLFAGVLDLATGRLHYCNAAHRAPLLVGKSVNVVAADENVPLGINSSWNYTLQETTLAPSTLFFAYTNGLVDAENADHKPFGEDRMKGEALQSVYGKEMTPVHFIERMNSTLRRHIGSVTPKDDLTMLAILYRHDG